VLRRREIRVAGEPLDRPRRRAPHRQVRTERVPQNVHALLDAGGALRRANRARRQPMTLSGAPLDSRSGLKWGRSRRPSNITTSASGGADAAAAVSSARFPDLRCRLPQMARIFIGGSAGNTREHVADAATSLDPGQRARERRRDRVGQLHQVGLRNVACDEHDLTGRAKRRDWHVVDPSS